MKELEDDKPSWNHLSVFNLLMTTGGAAAVVAVLVFVANSSVSGLGYLWTILIAWSAFGAVLSLGGLAILMGSFALDLVLLPVKRAAVRDRVYWVVRWTVLVTGLGALLWMGGRGAVEGLRDNRLVPQQVLYERCMQPRTRAVRNEYKTCRDGWRSGSIGRLGACSHHGGVVRRWVERHETYQEHEAAYCRADAARRSWVD